MLSSSLIVTMYVVIARFRVFFFQAEDGIRDADVTGVQTCALPISPRTSLMGMFDYPEQTWADSMSGESQSKPSGQKWEGAGPPAATGPTKIEPKQILIPLVLSLSLAIIVIDATIAIVAPYRISPDFKIHLKDLEWITSLYSLVFGSFLLTWGKLSDEFGRKRIFISG